MIKRFFRPASAQKKIANWYIDKFYEDIVQVLQDQAKLQRNSVVVEFGCDRGILAHYLRHKCKLILSDLSDEREIQEAMECEFHQTRAEETDFETSSVDIIIMISVYHHLSNFDQFAQESARILKPQGKLVLVEPIKSHPVTMFLNLLSKVVHAGNANWSEPYGLALWINDKFIKRQLSKCYQLIYKSKLDAFLWGINAFVPRPILRTYDFFQRKTHLGNTEIYVFQKTSTI